MSRVMTRVAGGVANGATVTVLTVPTAHKYEVLEIGFWGTSGGGGINVAEVIFDGTTTVLSRSLTAPAGLFVDSFVHNAVALLAGDTYSIACANTTGGLTYWLTYMDVDV